MARPPDQPGLFWVDGGLAVMVASWTLVIVIVDSLGVLAAVGAALVLTVIAIARLIRSRRHRIGSPRDALSQQPARPPRRTIPEEPVGGRA